MLTWLPHQIDALEMSIDKDRVVLKTAFSAPEAENPTTELKGLELILSDVDFDVSLDYDLTKRIWDQLDLRMRIRLTTEDLQEELPDCVITASVQKQDKCWQIIGEVEALHFASLAMLLPLNGRETMIQMMGHSMLLDLKVKYRIEEEGSPNLSFTYVLFLTGLELDLVYEHPTKGQWTLHATLAVDS